jgi:predicted extracellular nuclease
MRRILATATAGALVGAAVLATPAQAAKKDGGDLKVMTQNLYLGADLFPAVEAASQGTTEFLLAAAKVYQEAMASDFETRAKQLAKTVKAKKPAIIGLQEVTNWAAGRTNEGPALQSQDFLKIVNKALKDEGLAYKVCRDQQQRLSSGRSRTSTPRVPVAPPWMTTLRTGTVGSR